MSASKWPRIKWNQANARLANAPFENLFREQEHKMSALDDALTQAEFGAHPDMDIAPAWAELAQLRADLQAAQDERDGAKAWHISLNAMIDRKNATIAEQARQLDEANRLIRVINQRIYLKRDLQVEVNHWLAVNPAPSPDEQRCTCGTGDATMPEYHAAGCALKAEPQP